MKAQLAAIRLPLTVTVIVSVFVLDLSVPAGRSVWLLYVLPLLLLFRLTDGRHLYPLTATCTVLIGVGYIHASSQGIPAEVSLFNRSLGAFVLWVTAFLLVQSKQAEEAMRASDFRMRTILAATLGAEASLRESERRFHMMADNAPVMIWLAGPDMRCTFFNKQWLDFTGRSMNQELGSGWTEGVHPDDFPRCMETYRLACQTGRNFRIDFRLRRADGEYRWILNTGGPLLSSRGEPAGFIGSCIDITDRKRKEDERGHLYEQVHAGRERLQALSRRLLQVQEEERRSLARELHDEIGQALTAMKINLQTVLRDAPADRIASRLNDSITIVDRMLMRVRALSLELRPPLLDELGLPSALNWYVSGQAQRAGLSADLDIDSLNGRLPTDIETACFRVAQEALTNIIRHAQASRVSITLQKNEAGLELSIRDDGRGFNVEATMKHDKSGGHVGLLGMHERVRLLGGQLSIDSAPTRGTVVRASFSPDAPRPAETRDPVRVVR